MNTTPYRLMLVLLSLTLSENALAAGPIDGDANLVWWSNDLDIDSSGDIDAGSFGINGQLWWQEQWGLKGALYQSDVGGSTGAGDIDYLSVDIKRRLLAASEDNYLAGGVGWEHLKLHEGNTDGLRLVLEGRVGVSKLVYLYGHSAWIPVMSDTDEKEDLDAFEFEAGVGISPLPFVNLNAGWRQFNLGSSDAATGDSQSDKASGFVVGAGIYF